MWIFYFLFWTAVRANEERLYRKIGDQAVLTPDSVENPITSIKWKHELNLAMQWYGDEPISYKQFKVRGSLNISTGVMTITGLTRNDSGIYTAEINGKETNKTQLLVISPVPKPTIYKSCDPGMTSCVLTCSGNITGAEPVTYWWTAGEKRWNSTNQHKITKVDKEQWFNCTLKNPVSSNISEKVFNPLMKSSRTWIYILVAVILVGCIIVAYFIYKYRKGQQTVDGPEQEMEEQTPALQNTSTQNTTSAAPPGTSNETAPDLQSSHRDLKPQWQYAGRSEGEWRDFRETVTSRRSVCSVTIKDIERRYQENHHSSMPLIMNGEPNTLDINAQAASDLQSSQRDQSPLEYEGRKRGGSCHLKRTIDTPNECSVTNDDIERQQEENPHSSETLTGNGSPTELDFKTPDLQSSHRDQSPLESEGRRSGGSFNLKRKIDTPEQCSVTSNDIERQYRQNCDSSMSFTVNTPRSSYKLDLKAKRLTNLETNSLRKIRRVLLTPE